MSQTIAKFSIDSGGDITSIGGLDVLYTIGEVYVQEVTANNIIISGGFINPITNESLTVSDYEMFNVKIYPNPVQNELFIKTNLISEFEFYDLTGKVLIKGILNQGFNSILLSKFCSGIYVLKLINEQGFREEKIIIN
jgi:hypothetical protein